MSNKKLGTGREAQYARYKANNTCTKNKVARLTTLLNKFPENEQLKTAIKTVGYSRKTPKTRVWSKTKIREAMVLRPSKNPVPIYDNRSMFSISKRVGLQ